MSKSKWKTKQIKRWKAWEVLEVKFDNNCRSQGILHLLQTVNDNGHI